MPARILLVEDNEINQNVTRLTLEGAGYTVDAVRDAEQAVEACNGHAYDMVLLDHQMPQRDRSKATRQIRKLGNNQPAIIALTVHFLGSLEKDCLNGSQETSQPT